MGLFFDSIQQVVSAAQHAVPGAGSPATTILEIDKTSHVFAFAGFLVFSDLWL